MRAQIMRDLNPVKFMIDVVKGEVKADHAKGIRPMLNIEPKYRIQMFESLIKRCMPELKSSEVEMNVTSDNTIEIKLVKDESD